MHKSCGNQPTYYAASPTKTTLPTATFIPTDTPTSTPEPIPNGIAIAVWQALPNSMKELAGREGYHADATKIWDAQGLVHALKAPSGQWVDLRATDAQGNVIEGAWSYTFSDGYSIPPMRVFATEKDAARCIIANGIHWGEVRDFGPASQTSADSQFVSRQHWNSFPIKPGHEHIPSNVYDLSSQGKTAYLRSIDIDVTAIPFDGIQIWWRNQTTGNLDRVLVIGVDINRTNGVSVP